MIEEGSVLDSPGLPVLSQNTLGAAVKQAYSHSKITIVHVLTFPTAQTAVDIGIDGVAHLFIDQPHTTEIVSSIAKANVFFTPYLGVNASLPNTLRSEKSASDPRVSCRLSPPWLSTLKASFNTYPTGGFDDDLATVKALHDAGVDILASTDVSVPMAEFGGLAHGASVHHELQLFVEAGFSPAEVLKTATSVPAKRFGLGDRGKVEVGKRADLLLVKGNPTKDIDDTLNIENIWRRGVKVIAA
ncbi:putative organophosphate acid anhydrase [Phaeomoniella chlamydospora]|uniref:Putative organophosphate acid anhydrase n=1 Tax=Phaeomoniella chlamydospora TaxID=158046 RepID=A0A0G2E8Q4_PHACM|nr:putative organophosphate acid anhydrase [Phaeomoniella chlamydospora]